MSTMIHPQPPPHPMKRLAQHLLRGMVLPHDARFGVALRTPAAVVGVVVRSADAYTIELEADVQDIPAERCVLTIMVDAVARIDLPVRLFPLPDGALQARVDGVPLVLRRRVTVNSQLSKALAA